MLLCMRTTIHIDDALFTEAKKHSAETRQTFRQLVEEGLRLVLRQQEEPSSPRGKPRLPLSKAKGGPRPGVNLNSSRDLEELMNEA